MKWVLIYWLYARAADGTGQFPISHMVTEKTVVSSLAECMRAGNLLRTNTMEVGIESAFVCAKR